MDDEVNKRLNAIYTRKGAISGQDALFLCATAAGKINDVYRMFQVNRFAVYATMKKTESLLIYDWKDNKDDTILTYLGNDVWSITTAGIDYLYSVGPFMILMQDMYNRIFETIKEDKENK